MKLKLTCGQLLLTLAGVGVVWPVFSVVGLLGPPPLIQNMIVQMGKMVGSFVSIHVVLFSPYPYCLSDLSCAPVVILSQNLGILPIG